MGKIKKPDASPFKQFKEWKKDCDKKTKELEKQVKEAHKKVKELEKQKKEDHKKITELEKKTKMLENQKNAESKDSSYELSEYAQLAIKVSNGPLNPKEIENFLKNVVSGRKSNDTLTVYKKYSKNIDAVKSQLLRVHDNVKIYMLHREEQKKLDDRLIKTMQKLDKMMEEELDKITYDGESPLTRNSNGINNGKCNRKRKFVNDYENSQDSAVGHLASDFNKHAKVNSSEASAESNLSSEFEEESEEEDSDVFDNQKTISQRELRN